MSLPTAVAALGDSITAGWGSGTDAADRNVPGVDPSDSWSTGDSPTVKSHYLRLLDKLPRGSTMAAVNLAEPGASIADPRYGLVAQAREVPVGTQYVLFGGGTADVCVPTDPSQLLTPRQFGEAFRAGLQTLRTRLAGVRVFVASIPNWYRLWQNPNLRDRPRPAYACPLIFGADASDATAAALDRAIRADNAVLGKICAELATICRFDGGAAYKLDLTEADLSDVDWFHLSARGQERLAAATWAADPFRAHSGSVTVPAPRPAARPAKVPALPPAKLHAPSPRDAVAARGIALVAAAVDVNRPALLKVVVLDRLTRRRLPLLTGSAVGSTVTVNGHTAIYDHDQGTIAIRLRISQHALAARKLSIEVTAHAEERTSVLEIPFAL